jgi:hypothetical protein
MRKPGSFPHLPLDSAIAPPAGRTTRNHFGAFAPLGKKTHQSWDFAPGDASRFEGIAKKN